MHAVRGGRLLTAVAFSAFVGACADQSIPVGPVASAAPESFKVSTAAEGDLVICKDGNAAGTFTFDVSYTPKDVSGVPSAPRANDQVSVDVGACVTLPKITVGRYLATVTEQAPPADWAVTDIVVVSNQPPFAGGPVVIDLPGRMASNIGVSNDNGATITFTNTYTPPPPPAPGCTYTLGYWKTHSKSGPAPYDPTWALLGASEENTSFYLSGQTWLAVFKTAPAGNAYYQLAHQYMAAKLNVLGGADPTVAASAIAAAEALFGAYTPAQVAALAKNSPVRAQFISLSGTLDQYNNGIIGPGHCN